MKAVTMQGQACKRLGPTDERLCHVEQMNQTQDYGWLANAFVDDLHKNIDDGHK